MIKDDDFEKALNAKIKEFRFAMRTVLSESEIETQVSVISDVARWAKSYFENEGKTKLLENEMGKILDVLKDKNNTVSELLIALENMVAQCCEFDEVYEDAKATCGKYSGRLTGKHDF